MNRVTAIRRRNGESGQVLILAVIAMVLVILATLILFDVHTVIRGKVKAQNGVDAAAITAAEWQRHSLNVIGDLNLARATCTLLSDPYFGEGILGNESINGAYIYDQIRENQKIPEIDLDKFTSIPDAWKYFDPNQWPGETLKERKANMMAALYKELNRVEAEKQYLVLIDQLISQMQTRVSFVGPMIAFGAAQQAAKNNGLRYDPQAGEMFLMYRNILKEVLHPLYHLEMDSDDYSDEDDIYGSYPVLPLEVNGYYWGSAYYQMLSSIVGLAEVDTAHGRRTQACGIAVSTNFTFSGMPELTSDSWIKSMFLGQSGTYDDIVNRNWRAIQSLLDDDYGDNWWQGLSSQLRQDFTSQSEILPLHIEFSSSRDPYDEALKAGALDRYKNGNRLFGEVFDDENPIEYTIPITKTESEPRVEMIKGRPTIRRDTMLAIGDPENIEYNPKDKDTRFNLLPYLSWALFDPEWRAYSDETRRTWQNDLFKRNFRGGLDYHSGARAYFNTSQKTGAIIGSMAQPKKKGNPNEFNENIGLYFGDAVSRNKKLNDASYSKFLRDLTLERTPAKRNAYEVSNALYRFKDDGTIPTIQTNAMAKPIGVIRTKGGEVLRPFEAGRMVLPVFTDTTMIPISLEPVDGISSEGFASFDLEWLYFMRYIVPELESSGSIEEAWETAVRKHSKLASCTCCKKCCQALMLLDDANFRQEGITWLEDNPLPPPTSGNSPGTGSYGNYGERKSGFENLKLH